MCNTLRVLLLAASKEWAGVARRHLEAAGAACWVRTGADAVRRPDSRHRVDVLVVDASLVCGDAAALVTDLRGRHGDLPLVLCGDSISLRDAVDAVHSGAADCLQTDELSSLAHRWQSGALGKGFSQDACQTLADVAQAVVFVVDRETRILYMNPFGESLFGTQAGELQGKVCTEMSPPDLAAMQAESVRQVCETNKPLEIERRYTLGGRDVWLLFRLVPLHDAHGEADRVLGVGHDISERRLAEGALNEAGRTLSTLMKNLPGMAYRCLRDPKWTTEFVSEGCVGLTGYQSGELINNAVVAYADIIHPEDRERVWLEVEAGLNTTGDYELQYRIVHRDGSIRWVWEQGCGVPARNGEGERLEGFIADITERMESEAAVHRLNTTLERRIRERTAELESANRRLTAEAAERERVQEDLRRTEATSRALLAAIPDLIFHIDAHGVFLDFSAPSLDVLAKQPEEFLGRTIFEMLPRSIYTRAASCMEQARATGEVQVMEYEFETPRYGKGFFEARVATTNLGDLMFIIRDITGRKRMENDLRASEEYLRGVLESQLDLIIRTDPKGRFTFVNDAYCQTFGKSREELLGVSFMGFVHPDDQGAVQNLAAQIEKPPYRLYIEQRVLTVNGVRWFAWQDYAVRDEKGRLKEIQAVGRDITELKETAESLRESGEYLRGILDSQTDYVVRADCLGSITYVNDGLCAACGLDRALLLGEPFHRLIHPEDLPLQISAMEGLLEAPFRALVECRMLMKGEWRLISWQESAVRDQDGVLTEVQAVGRDVTDSRRMETALRESEQRYRAIVEDQTELICRYTPDGCLTFLNEAYCRYFNLTRAGILGKPFFPLVHPDDMELLRRHHESFSAGKQVATVEHRVLKPDGTVAWQRWTDRAITDASGQIVEFQSVGSDITEKRNLEVQQQQQLQFLQTLIDTIPIPIFYRDALGRHMGCNEAFEKVVGCSRAEVVGKTMPEVCPPGWVDATAVHDEALLAHPGQQVFSAQLPFADGSVHEVLVSRATFHAVDGAVAGIVATLQDVTDIRRQNQELTTLNAVSAKISTSMDLKELLSEVSGMLSAGMDIRAGHLMLYDESRDVLLPPVACWGVPEDFRVRMNELATAGVCGCREAVRTRQAYLIPDLGSESVPESLRQAAEDLTWRSCLAVPLMAQNSIQGVMVLFRSSTAEFAVRDTPFYTTMGQQIGLAIQRSRLYDELRAGNERLQTLSRRVVEVQEEERQNIARELHDEIGQLLTGLKLTLGMAARASGNESERYRSEAENLASNLMERVRSLSLDLRPAMLDDLGLVPALMWYFGRYTAQTGVKVGFRQNGPSMRYAPALETAAYRIVQEALTNVARHAGVSHVDVRVTMGTEVLRLDVQDKGEGFDSEGSLSSGQTAGLSGMQERAVLLGGRLDIIARPGKGTRIRAELPVSGSGDSAGMQPSQGPEGMNG